MHMQDISFSKIVSAFVPDRSVFCGFPGFFFCEDFIEVGKTGKLAIRILVNGTYPDISDVCHFDFLLLMFSKRVLLEQAEIMFQKYKIGFMRQLYHKAYEFLRNF